MCKNFEAVDLRSVADGVGLCVGVYPHGTFFDGDLAGFRVEVLDGSCTAGGLSSGVITLPSA